MSVETKDYVIGLLQSYHTRMNQIALLHYELEHPARVFPEEMIEAMSFGHGDGIGSNRGKISNKTLYIALNYQERTDQVNAEAHSEVVKRLVELEQEQDRLAHYISLLYDRQKMVICRFYFENKTWGEIARELHVVTRTVHKIKNQALDRLVGMYAFAEGRQR